MLVTIKTTQAISENGIRIPEGITLTGWKRGDGSVYVTSEMIRHSGGYGKFTDTMGVVLSSDEFEYE